MSTSRLADRQIRAAASQAALRLDVRGPVSQALGKAGIVVPPEPLATSASAAPEPARTAGRSRARAAERVLKPFEPAPWPTKRPASAPMEPLSGLTADERRVHRILLDSLARLNAERNGGLGGLSFAERKKLETLDLGYLDDQLAAMVRRRKTTTTALQVGMTAGVLLVPLLALGLFLNGVLDAVPIVLGALIALAGVGAALAAQSGVGRSASPRQAIYEALRELALVADADDATSEALAQADLLIDTLADADESAMTAAARRARVRT